jgi:hypothetical protein
MSNHKFNTDPFQDFTTVKSSEFEQVNMAGIQDLASYFSEVLQCCTNNAQEWMEGWTR